MWAGTMNREELEELALLKRSKLLRPYAKFLLLLCKYGSLDRYTNILKEVVGGSYVIYAKEGVLDGIIEYSKGKPPRLTEKGRQLCPALMECWERLREKEREIWGED